MTLAEAMATNAGCDAHACEVTVTGTIYGVIVTHGYDDRLFGLDYSVSNVEQWLRGHHA